jgi:hypothetical protein
MEPTPELLTIYNKDRTMRLTDVIERVPFLLMAALCGLQVGLGNYGLAVFIGFLALDMTTSNGLKPRHKE